MTAALPLEDSPYQLDEHGPVFILGCPRSGTTFLSACVARVRGAEEFVGILCPPRMCHAIAMEDRPEREELLFASIRDTFWNSFWRRRYSRLARLAGLWHGRLRFRDLFAPRSMSGALFCYKEPFLCFGAEKFAHHFSAAKFIHIIRDGRDNADSLSRRYPEALSDVVLRDDNLSLNKNAEIGVWTTINGVNVPWWVAPAEQDAFAAMSRYERCVLLWREMTARAQALRALGPERYLEMRYEDLVRDPDHWSSTVVKFLGRDIDRHVRRAFNRGHTQSVGVSGKNQSEEARMKAIAIAGDLLRELGYDL